MGFVCLGLSLGVWGKKMEVCKQSSFRDTQQCVATYLFIFLFLALISGPDITTFFRLGKSPGAFENLVC